MSPGTVRVSARVAAGRVVVVVVVVGEAAAGAAGAGTGGALGHLPEALEAARRALGWRGESLPVLEGVEPAALPLLAVVRGLCEVAGGVERHLERFLHLVRRVQVRLVAEVMDGVVVARGGPLGVPGRDGNVRGVGVRALVAAVGRAVGLALLHAQVIPRVRAAPRVGPRHARVAGGASVGVRAAGSCLDVRVGVIKHHGVIEAGAAARPGVLSR
mmetsp:Transcript_98864/g.282683  ORF Transcript_98864/g.282683 Transcript_98864/m.282683 type:complete len:215 (+) Transcript_98864:740-1384(+)